MVEKMRSIWEADVARRATHFIVSRPILPHKRGEQRQWNKKNHDTLLGAVDDYNKNGKALVYAIAGTESFPISEKDFTAFMVLRGEVKGVMP